jgi:hypothetical protein
LPLSLFFKSFLVGTRFDGVSAGICVGCSGPRPDIGIRKCGNYTSRRSRYRTFCRSY